MAQNTFKNINQVIHSLFMDYKKSLKKAAQYASNIASKDIYMQSMSCLWDYYENYNPTSYYRTDSLWQAFVPYANIQENKSKLIVAVGVAYDASRIDGVYSGSKQYTPTDASWILDNYLKGIHPTTNGAILPETIEYYEVVDAVSPTEKMQKYLTDYAKEFYYNILIGFAKQIML